MQLAFQTTTSSFWGSYLGLTLWELEHIHSNPLYEGQVGIMLTGSVSLFFFFSFSSFSFFSSFLLLFLNQFSFSLLRHVLLLIWQGWNVHTVILLQFSLLSGIYSYKKCLSPSYFYFLVCTTFFPVQMFFLVMSIFYLQNKGYFSCLKISFNSFCHYHFYSCCFDDSSWESL